MVTRIMSEPTTVTVTTKNTPSLTMGIISIVLGVLGMLISWVPFIGMLAIPVAVIGIILAIIGLVLAAVKRAGWSMPVLGGIICGIAIAISISVTGAASAVVSKAIDESNKRTAEKFNPVSRNDQAPNVSADAGKGASKFTVENLEVRTVENGFISSLEADFTVMNLSQKPIKDFTVTLHIHGGSGTIIASEEKTFYDILPAGEFLDYTKQIMGRPRSQGASYTATVTDYKDAP